ncbi:MAG: 50S ribosomal protein L9 [bacterium]|jgi:large subunit ribosomal protein L9
MSIEMILMQDVKDLGTAGQVVKVSEGYARNYLLPRNLAASVTEGNRRQLAKLQVQREIERKALKEKALDLAAAIQKGSYTIPVKVGEGDKLFGSVTSGDILKLLAAQGFELDKHAIELEQPIKELGAFDVKVKVGVDVETLIKVWVVQE